MPPHKYRVLLVDDYVPVRITLRSMLTGYPDLQIVGEACDGKQAIEQVAACQPDIILMDYHMPVMNGMDMIRQIRSRAQYKFTPILMLTTESQDAKKAEGKAAGATGWIVKPFNPDQLLTVIKKVLP